MISTKKKKKEQVKLRASFNALPVIDALGFIKIHKALDIAERSKESGMGSKPPSVLRDCMGI